MALTARAALTHSFLLSLQRMQKNEGKEVRIERGGRSCLKSSSIKCSLGRELDRFPWSITLFWEMPSPFSLERIAPSNGGFHMCFLHLFQLVTLILESINVLNRSRGRPLRHLHPLHPPHLLGVVPPSGGAVRTRGGVSVVVGRGSGGPVLAGRFSRTSDSVSVVRSR